MIPFLAHHIFPILPVVIVLDWAVFLSVGCYSLYHNSIEKLKLFLKRMQTFPKVAFNKDLFSLPDTHSGPVI